jgi:hypothetical protein
MVFLPSTHARLTLRVTISLPLVLIGWLVNTEILGSRKCFASPATTSNISSTYTKLPIQTHLEYMIVCCELKCVFDLTYGMPVSRAVLSVSFTEDCYNALQAG